MNNLKGADILNATGKEKTTGLLPYTSIYCNYQTVDEGHLPAGKLLAEEEILEAREDPRAMLQVAKDHLTALLTMTDSGAVHEMP
ncbi:hypothetical protein TURU_018370 [Turdus rufiventris]|nr:hypothetical protein TURU_018370 [Turdus rufiventris]